MDENNTTSTESADAAAETVITEKRVTRTVIRRRAKTAPTTPEDSVEEKKEVAAVEVEKPVVEEPKVEKEKTEQKAAVEPKKEPAKKKERKSVLKKAAEVKIPEPRVVQAAPPKVESEIVPEVQEGEGEGSVDKPSPYQDAYKRIKVVKASEKEIKASVVKEAPKKPPMPATPSTPRVAKATVDPSANRLTRKEVIEVRNYHKPKVGRKKRLAPGKKAKKTEITIPKASKRVIKIADTIQVAELAKRMSVKVREVIQKLVGMGMMVTINQSIDLDTATIVANEFGYEIENIATVPEDLLVMDQQSQEADKEEDLLPRAPVVTVMGHVDHGKTSLLDAIRKTDVVSKEAGGITQHIGAYSVKTEANKMVTFVDTPGHEAFTAMRARGAQITDVVILVVAADDGVMPQTKEAVNHAKSAKVPIIVAINKMDKDGADPDRVKKALTEFEMVPEEWGGDTLYVPVSAKTGEGIPQLLEMLALQSEMLELRANPDRLAQGSVVESRLDRRRGSVTTILVQRGTLKEGDSIVAGDHYGRIRVMVDDRGRPIKKAGPSTPVEITGMTGVPDAGDVVIAVENEKKAKQVSDLRKERSREKELSTTSKVSLDDLYQQIQKGDVKELKVIVKADTMGSVEVLTDTLKKLSTAKVGVNVIHGAVGAATESDIYLATASDAIIVCFHVRPDANARTLADRAKVDLRTYEIIYELTEDITKAMAGLLAPKIVENVLGRAEVKDIFTIPKIGTVAGCGVTDGKILRNAKVRLLRDDVKIYEGTLSSLRRFKDDVREVANGLECGIGIANYNDVKVGDVIEAFQVEEIAAEL